MPTLTTDQALQIALAHHQARQLTEAEAIYRQILAADPRHADALHLLGVVAHQVGRNEVAVDLIRRAMALAPAVSDYPSNLGEAYRALGQPDEAIAAYRQAIALKPACAEAHYNLGNALEDKGQIAEAIAAFRQAIALKPNYAEAHSNLGNVLKETGQLGEAIAAYRDAIAFMPSLAEAHSNLGTVLQAEGQMDQAIAAYRNAIALMPSFAEAHNNLASALIDKGNLDEAIAICRDAIALKPNCSEARRNAGTALLGKGRVDEAIASFSQAAALKPNCPKARAYLGAALLTKGQVDEAIAGFRRAVALDPNFAEAHFTLALALLLRGNFREGWEEYEWRWRMKCVASLRRNWIQPQWDGSHLARRTILLHAEQGFGDAIQFVRYLPLVHEHGGKIIVECQPELQRLLQAMAPGLPVVVRGQPLPAFDIHCPLLSLPRIFATDLTNIPRNVPYLRSKATDAGVWRDRLVCHSSSTKVGLVWAGDPRPHQPDANQIDRRRSMPLAGLAPLAGVPGVTFVSLQKGAPAAQAQTPPNGMTLLDWTNALHDFADTAALVECLDLVISVDTSVAHLAGALGKPVWLLNRFDTCWRWLLDRENSPWYPTMRIFRQPKPGDWDSVISRVADELAAFRP